MPNTIRTMTFAPSILTAVAYLMHSPVSEDEQCGPDEREYIGARLLADLLSALVLRDAKDVLRLSLTWSAHNARVMKAEPGMATNVLTLRCEVARGFAMLGTLVLGYGGQEGDAPAGAFIGDDLQEAFFSYRASEAAE